MSRYVLLPILAAIAGCTAERSDNEAEQANIVETRAANEVAVTDDGAAAAGNGTDSGPSLPDQAESSPVPEASAPAAPAASARVAEPKQESGRGSPSGKAAETQSGTAAEPKAEAEAPATACTQEHREMGHC